MINSPKKIRMLWSSDHHTLHEGTPTVHILSNLGEFFYKYNSLAETDIVVFGGDFFHKLVDASNSSMRLCEYWINKFLIRCAENNVVVRVLEGTSSHDWEQPEIFQILSPDNLDLKWVKELSIERIEKLDMTVLYVPDNMGGKKPEVIWDEVIDLLTKHNLEKVDFIFFHGSFKYQLDERFSKHSHDEKLWSTIVNYYIFAGHIHKPSECGPIRCSGSFDRTGHSEEHPKGGYIVDYFPDDKKCTATFYENKKALPYITLRITPETTTEELNDKLGFLMDKRYPKASHFWIRGGNPLVVNPIIQFFKQQYPQYDFKKENIVTHEAVIDDELYTEDLYSGITLTKDNIIPSLMGYLNKKILLVDEELASLTKTMEEFI